MKMPLFCVEGDDIRIFLTLEEASIELEPIDVWNNEYVFFDADGYGVEAYVVGGTNPADEPRLFGVLHVVSNNGHIRFKRRIPLERHQDEFVKLMIKYLKNHHIETSTNDMATLQNEILQRCRGNR